jgi:translation initiation factor 1
MVRKENSRIVYTTESGRICPDCGRPLANCSCKKRSIRPSGDGVVRVALEKKGRRGKTVSIINGLPGSDDELRELASELKRRCGSGGTLKDGVIEIQGDHRDTLVVALEARGLAVKRVGG